MGKTKLVRDYMTKNLVLFDPEMNVLDAMTILVERQISGAPVVDKLGNLVGMLSEADCLRVAFDSAYHEGRGGSVSEYMHPDVETVDANTNICDIIEAFIERGYRRLPVMHGDRLAGQISRSDVLRAVLRLSKPD